MRLLAISDLHVGHGANRAALQEVAPHPDDWLIVAGDVGETLTQLAWTWRVLCGRFDRVIWVPGNHELWTPPSEPQGPRGVERYWRMVEVCRDFGVITPEEPWPVFPADTSWRIAPLFLLYDYSFAPDGLDPEAAVRWAAEDGIRCADEQHLHPDPHPSRQAWCAERLQAAEARLSAVDPGERLVLVNHFPLRRDLVRIPRIPRFIPWCGTRRTEDWHRRFPVGVVVTGHLHVRATDWIDGVRFEEVSLGYPRHWDQARGVEGYLRTILPAAPPPAGSAPPTVFHR